MRLRQHGPTAVVVLAAAALILHAARFWWFTIEDAAISFSYAENLARGHGFVLTRLAAPVEGFSNPLWVAILTAPASAGIDLEPFAKLLGLLCAAAAGPLVYASARRAGLGGWLAALGPVLLAAFTGYALWAQAGLENGGYALAAAAAVLATLRELDDPAARPWSALALGSLLWLRPEAPLLVGGLLVARTVFVVLRRLPWRREVWLWGWVLGAQAVLLGLRWWQFQELVPNTFMAKRTGRPGYWGRGRRYLTDFVLDYRLWLLAWAPVTAWLSPRARPAAALALALLGAAVGFAWYAGGDWAHGHRFLTTAFLALALLGPLGIHGLATRVPERWRPRLAALAALAVLALIAAPAPARSDRIWRDPQFAITVSERADECHEVAGLGRWLELDRPLVLEVDVGGMSLCDELEILDWIGLGDWTMPRLGSQQPALREYVFSERRPDLGLGRGEVPPALAATPERDTSYLAVHRRGWHPRLSLWLRRDLVMAPFALPGPLGREVSPGVILRGGQVVPPVVAPGQRALALATLLVRTRLTRWPTLAIDVVSDAGPPVRVLAEALPGSDGRSPLEPGDVLLVRALVTLPMGAHSATLRAGGEVLATLTRGPAAEVTEAEAVERTALRDATHLGEADPAFIARRLLLARETLAGLRARARLLERPLPSGIGDDLEVALADVAGRLQAEAAPLPPDPAYARLLLAARAAPGRADLVRALQALRSSRRRRYSALEPLLALDLERRVSLGDTGDGATALALVDLDAERDAEVLDLARTLPHVEPAMACLTEIASANLGLAPPPNQRCPARLDPERARWQLGAPDPDLLAGGFEGTLAPWVPDGVPARVIDNQNDEPAELSRRWSGETRASTAGGGPDDFARARPRGRITSPALTIGHRYLTFWLGCRGAPGASWSRDLAVRLLVDGKPVLSAAPRGGRVDRVVWDLSPFQGRTATIEIVDASADAWIEADAFTFVGALP